MKTSLRRWLPLLLLAMPPVTAVATPQPRDEKPSPEPPVGTEVDEVTVEDRLSFVPASNTITAKLPIEREWTPANVGVVNHALIVEQNSRILGDALQNVSGVNVQTGQGVFDFFVVRGFDSITSGLVLTDGAPEPEATYYQLYNTEQVEIFKGPAGFLYGPNPLAGAVNLVRKQPVAADFGSISIQGGSFATYQGMLDWNETWTEGRQAFRLNALYRATDGYRDGIDGSVVGVNPSFTWQPSDTTRVNVNLEALRLDHTPDAGLPLVNGELPAVPRERSYASPFDRSEQDVARFQVDVEHRFKEHLALRNKSYYRGLDWLSNGTILGFVFPTPDASLAVSRNLLLLDDRQSYLGNQFELLWSAETGPLRHRLVTGIEVTRYVDRFKLDVALLPFIDLFEPVELATSTPPVLPGLSAAGDATSDIIAPYLIDDIEISPHLRLLVGARYDDIEFDDAVSSASRRHGKVSPLLGAVVRPLEDLHLYANFARSFAPPSPRVVGERIPEESQQVELGMRQRLLQGRLNLTAAVFEIDRENIAIPEDNGFTQQVGDQRSRGFELELATELASGLHGLLAYGYADSELTRFTEQVLIAIDPPTFITVDHSGNRAAFAPDHLARLWLGKTFDNGLTMAGGLRYVGEQFIAEDNRARIDDYLLVDLTAAFGLGNWRLSLQLQNLTDQAYETRGFGTSTVIPGQPIAATVGIDYRF